ncbi:MAG: hypothetical protein KC491_10230 [Dehalococcoidia bacterium]|nr:hypothetical protein [Dehalococcoidia bacterium]
MLSASARPRPTGGVAARITLLVLVAATGIVGYLGIRPSQSWILALTAVLVALAVDGIVRTHPRWRQSGFANGLVHLMLPGLAVLAAGLFIHETLDGYERTGAGILAALGVGAIALGLYTTVDYSSTYYGAMRIGLAVATYLAAFALFSVSYAADVNLPVSAIAVGVVAALLATELIRESRMLDNSSLIAGFAIGISLAELRVALYFFPLDGLLGGALLVIGFYLGTGLVHHLGDRDLQFLTLLEYLAVAGVAVAAVVFTRVTVGG